MAVKDRVTLCLCGADGTGKSTIAKKIATIFLANDNVAFIVRLRGGHVFAFLLIMLLKHFPQFRGKCNPMIGICIPSKMKTLWMCIELASTLVKAFTIMVISKLLRRNVIAERSPIDFLVWLTLTLRSTRFFTGIIYRIIMALSNSLCDVTIYIRANEEVLLMRRKGYVEEPVIPFELRIYDILARKLNLPIIDTSEKNPLESTEEAVEIIKNLSVQ